MVVNIVRVEGIFLTQNKQVTARINKYTTSEEKISNYNGKLQILAVGNFHISNSPLLLKMIRSLAVLNGYVRHQNFSKSYIVLSFIYISLLSSGCLFINLSQSGNNSKKWCIIESIYFQLLSYIDKKLNHLNYLNWIFCNTRIF